MASSGIKSETMYGFLSRVETVEAGESIDPGIVESGTRAVIQLTGSSDRDAVVQYICHLMRKVADCDQYFVLKPSHPLRDLSNKKRKSDSKLSLATKSMVKKDHNCFEVLIVDELMHFDLHHYAATLPSDEYMRKVGIIRNPEPFVCLASLNRLISKSALFLSGLRLVVLFLSECIVEEVLEVLRQNSLKNCSIILVAPFVPNWKVPAGFMRLKLQLSSRRQISISRLLTGEKDQSDEEVEMGSYDIMGRKDVKKSRLGSGYRS